MASGVGNGKKRLVPVNTKLVFKTLPKNGELARGVLAIFVLGIFINLPTHGGPLDFVCPITYQVW